MNSPQETNSDIMLPSIWPFIFITFVISWGLIGLYIAIPEYASTLFGELSGTHPFFFISVWSPSIAASILVMKHFGMGGLGRFYRRLMQWRTSRFWWTFLFVITPAIFYIGVLVKGTIANAFVFEDGLVAVTTLLVIRLFLGPMEEFGWRGFALPLLQRKFNPLLASVVLGLLWGIWHLPVFFMSSMQHSQWSIIPFILGNIFLCILFTAQFNSSRGGLAWPFLFHYQLINPIWPDAQPFDTILFGLLSIIIVYMFRKQMFDSQHAYTEVVPANEIKRSQ